MKPIRRLGEASDGLKDYLAGDGEQANWKGFRSHQGGEAYQELVQVLYHIQHGLCGYCEINIIPRDKQVEHVVPRSHSLQGKAGELDPANMMLCCQGGTCLNNDNERRRKNDNERKRKPIKGNCSCGQAKGNSVDPQFIDPRDLPPLPSLVRVDDEGKISADEDACTDARIDVSRVEKTIQILGLNIERLRRARRKHWDALNDNLKEYFDNPNIINMMNKDIINMMKKAARGELLPGKDGRLPPFFSTSRSYFGPVAEEILAEAQQKWI